MPDPTFEMYYGLPFQPPESQQHGRGGPATGAQADMRIRGRGLGEDKDDDVEDDSMSDGSVDGASFCSDSLLPDAPDVEVNDGGRVLNLRGGSGGSRSEDNVPVCSFSGYAFCNFHFARAFYSAVDTALVLGARVNVHITVALIRALPGDFTEMVKLERGTLGSVQSEKDLHDRLLAAYTQARRDSAKGSLAFFVCHQSQEQALIELQQKGKGARTICSPMKDPETFQFEKQDSSGRSAAYLWMPPTVGKVTAANLYAKWFKTVVRIASGPHGPTQTLGRSKVQVPRADYAVQVGDISPSFHQESPLPREVWEEIVRRGQKTGVGITFNLSLTSLRGQAFAQVPGYYPRDSSTAAVLNPEAVFQLAWDSVPVHDRSSVARMVIRRPGDAGTAVFTCKNGSVDHSNLSNNNSRGKLLEWLKHKYFFNIVPEWDEYDATVRGSNGRPSWDFKFPGRTGWSDIRSRLLAACDQAGWKIGDHDIGQVVLRIDQRTAVGEAAGNVLHKNRIAWFMDIGYGPKENKLWSEFRAALSVKRVTIEPLSKYKQDRHGNPSVTDPLASDGQQALWNRWGCNRGSVNEDTGEPVVESPPAQTETQGQTRAQTQAQTQTQTQTQAHEHHHQQDGDNHGGQPAQDQGILHQGVPQLGAGVDIFQSGKYYREQSFATPLSVQVGDQKPRFPINAPPIEHVRRPRGPDGIESDSMPIVSTQIMTPTEQRTLQQAFFQMRSIALNRAQQCPHKDCTAFFPVGQGNMAAFHAHLDAKHVGTHCPFCDETLFKHWSPMDRQKHFVNNHSEYFTARGDLLREAILADKTKSKGNVHRREEQYSFCPRCGRNHQLLSSKADRVHHDNVCFPGNEATLPAEQYCRRCGKPDHVLVAAEEGRRRQQHQCAATGTGTAHNAPASDIFCSNCALQCHQLPASYGRRHMLNCKPLASKPDSWCPWCGVDLKSGPRSVRLKHLANCSLKPPSGQNPVCTDSGVPLESPRDHKARLLKHGLSNLGIVERKTRIAVPPKCPVKDCRTDLTSWNAQGLYYHFQSHPENVLEKGGGLKSCPFCACNFEMRGFHTSFEKQQHFDAHIKQQHRRVLDDETIGSNPDRESSAVLDAISTSRYDGRDQTADEIDRLRAENEQLSENIKRLSVDNRKFRDAQLKSQSTYYQSSATHLSAPAPAPLQGKGKRKRKTIKVSPPPLPAFRYPDGVSARFS